MADKQGSGTPDWRRLHIWQIQPVRDVLVLLAIFGLLYLGYVLRPVTVPILLALGLAYLFEPLVERITRGGRLPRQAAAAMIIVATIVTITVPVAVGVSFATLEGISFARRTAVNVGEARIVVGAFSSESITQTGGADGSPGSGTAPEQTRDAPESDASGAGRNGRPGVLTGLDSQLEAFDDWIEADAPPQAKEAWAALSSDGWRTLTRLAATVFPENWIEQLLAGTENNLRALFELGVGAGAGAAATAGGLLRRLFSLGLLFFSAFLTAFFFFFMCTGYARVLAYLENLIPDRNREETVDLIRKMDRVVAGFLRGRLTIAVIQSLIFAIAYFVAGVPAALLIGFIVGFLSIVPYLALVGLPTTMLLLALDPPGGFRGEWWWIVGAPIVIYFAVQALDDYVWTPLIQGKQTGLDTPTVLFSSIAGGILAGVYGLLLAIPVAACIKILLQELFWPRFHAWAEGEASDPLPLGTADRGPGRT